MEIEQFAANLDLKEGIWYSKLHTPVFYPEDGNDNCFKLEQNNFFWFRHRSNCIVELVKKYNANKEPFFDIGGSNGYISAALEQEEIETFLIEPGWKGIKNAKEKGLKNLICSTLEDAHLKKDSLPNAGLFDVIEHIENDGLFLQQVFSYLKPGGKVFITVPAYKFLWSTEDDHAGHFNRYTLNSIREKLEMCRFKTIYSSYLFSFLPLPVFLFRTLPFLLKMKRKKDVEVKPKIDYPGKNILGMILKPILDWELSKIKKQEKIPFGGSCLIVCIKK